MDLYILNDNLSIVGVIDEWESFIWVRKYREADSFELTINKNNTRVTRRLLPQHYIARPDSAWVPTMYHIGYISSVRDQNDGEKETIIVSGYGAEGIFRKRLFPFWLTYTQLREMNLKELIQALNPFGCRMQFNMGGFNPNILNVPADYLQGNMEDYLRYITTSEETQYTYHVLLRYMADDELNNTDENAQLHPNLYFMCESFENILYPHNILSEGTDNFTNVQYSFSEDGTYSKIYVRVNPEFSVSVTVETDEKDEDGNPVTRSQNITYADVETLNLPEYTLDLTEELENYKKIYSSYMAVNEHLIFVDPIIKKGQKVIRGQSFWLKSDVPIGNCMISHDGTQYLVSPEETVDSWYIDVPETLKAMEKAAKDIALIGTENFTGRMSHSEIPVRNTVILGRIVLVRDDKRNTDYYKRVEEIEESWDNNGHSYQPTLGEPLKNIYDLIESR